MRVLIKLRAAKNQSYESLYHHKLQGFVYGLLRDSGFEEVHDKTGYKFFCFSNIFPIKDVMSAGEAYNLIISAPNTELISAIANTLEKSLGHAERSRESVEINIGEMLFDVVGFKKLEIELKEKDLKVLTATPIVIRIPERNYELYGIPEEERKARYVYWRPKYRYDTFLKQLNDNLIKKFNDFYGTKLREYELFERFTFRRTTATKVVIEDKEYVLIGSMWKFKWKYMNVIQRKILEFGLDTGFGERNSLGFGFVNKIF